MSFLKEHPIAALAIGAALGYVFAQQFKRIPGVSKLPQV
jgi:hypothetical protein